jgi:putative nucleotidyltransferase with HDIG domain
MKTFHTDDEEVMLGIRIKEVHTGYVTSIARELARHLELNEHDVQLAEIMGLFHDVGRFRQYSLYQTFNDSQSEDHADLGLKVLDELELMKKLAPEDEALVRFAIKNHNKKVIEPTDSKRELLFAKLLRDADKLDIYRVLTPYLDNEEAIREVAEPAGFKLALLWRDRDITKALGGFMTDEKKMLDDLFDVSDKLYGNMCLQKENNHA